jgi:hypothetical protein
LLRKLLQALLRTRKDYSKEVKDNEELSKYKSDGLQNLSASLRSSFTDNIQEQTETSKISWEPPKTWGLDNSVRISDAASALEGNASDTRS